jgi:hypothetical protein
MPDVLTVLSKLPPVAAVWSEADQCGVLIKRGVMGTTPFPLATQNEVLAFNIKHRVTPAQLRAMETGCVCGWDAPGADVPTPEGGDPMFTYTAPFTMMISVQAPTEETAAKIAHQSANNFEAWIMVRIEEPNVLTLTRDGDQLDLIE